MNNSFDEAYARYLSFLSKLDTTDDISEKNLLFRELTGQLGELESRLHCRDFLPEHDEYAGEDADLTYWI